MMDDILRESSFAAALRDLWVEEGLEEGIAKGREKGLEEGREKGLEEGRAEATRQAARVALQGRFGALGADLLAALNAANEQVLMDIIAGVTTETLQQVRQRLGLPPE